MIAGYYRSRIFSRKAATGRHILSYRQLRVKDLPEVPTWRLEVEPNQRPSAPKSTTPACETKPNNKRMQKNTVDCLLTTTSCITLYREEKKITTGPQQPNQRKLLPLS